VSSQVAGAETTTSAFARPAWDASLVACAAISVAVGVLVGDIGFGAVIALVALVQMRRARSSSRSTTPARVALLSGAVAVVAGLAFGQLFDRQLGALSLVGFDLPVSRVAVTPWIGFAAFAVLLVCLGVMANAALRAPRAIDARWYGSLPLPAVVATAFALCILADGVLGWFLYLALLLLWAAAMRIASSEGEGRDDPLVIAVAFACATLVAGVVVMIAENLPSPWAVAAIGAALFAASTWFSLEPLPRR
jgi:hypothetical protein